jgi:hypothetical protein
MLLVVSGASQGQDLLEVAHGTAARESVDPDWNAKCLSRELSYELEEAEVSLLLLDHALSPEGIGHLVDDLCEDSIDSSGHLLQSPLYPSASRG